MNLIDLIEDKNLELANTKFRDVGKIREINLNDSKRIFDLQMQFKDLDYTLDSIKYAINQKSGINYLIEKENDLLGFVIGYAGQEYEKVQEKMPWDVPHINSELKDPSSFYIELKVIKKEAQGQGVYKILRSLLELEAIKQGYKEVFLHSVESAKDIHDREYPNSMKKLPNFWFEDGKYSDAYMFSRKLDEDRIKKAYSVLK